MTRPALRVVTDPDAELAAKVVERDAMRRALRELEAEISEGCRTFSYARGYRVPLRVEQVVRIIEEEAAP